MFDVSIVGYVASVMASAFALIVTYKLIIDILRSEG